jgi:ATP-dependent Zn protease
MTGDSLVGILINWFPMIILIGAWIFIMQRMRSGKMSKYQQECFDLAKRQAEAVERIAAALEKRP